MIQMWTNSIPKQWIYAVKHQNIPRHSTRMVLYQFATDGNIRTNYRKVQNFRFCALQK